MSNILSVGNGDRILEQGTIMEDTDNKLTVVKAAQSGALLRITIHGQTREDVTGVAARKLAFDARLKWGLFPAGISQSWGVVTTQREDKTWEGVWTLTIPPM